MFIWMVSHPGQILIVDGWCPILVTAPKFARGCERYFTYQHEFISITCLSTGAARVILVTAPKFARGNVRYKGEKVVLMFTYIALIYTSIWCHKRSWSRHQNYEQKRMGKCTKGGTSNIHLYSLFLSSSRVPN